MVDVTMTNNIARIPLKPSTAMLKEVQLLANFSDNELALLVQKGEPQFFEPHSNVVIEGEQTYGLYLILSGAVGIFKKNKLTGANYDIGQFGQGNFFGEMSLIDDAPRSATVKALADTQLYYISQSAFKEFLQQNTDTRIRFLESCIKILSGRIRSLGDDYIVSQYQLWKIALKKEAS